MKIQDTVFDTLCQRSCDLQLYWFQLSTGADVNRTFFDESLGNVTPLLIVLKQGNCVSDMVHLLISNGADVNAERHDDRTGKEVSNILLRFCKSASE